MFPIFFPGTIWEAVREKFEIAKFSHAENALFRFIAKAIILCNHTEMTAMLDIFSSYQGFKITIQSIQFQFLENVLKVLNFMHFIVGPIF